MSKRRRKRSSGSGNRKPIAATSRDAEDHAQVPPARLTWSACWPFLVAAALPAWLLAMRVSLDLWNDEAYTLHQFVARPLGFIATNYPSANNHILFSMLLRPFFLAFSETGLELLLRLPALVISLATLLGVYSLGRRMGGKDTAVLAVLTLGLNQMFLIHTMQLRGYGLSILLGVCLAHCLLAVRPVFSVRRALVITLLGAAWLYTIPTNALFLAAMSAAALGVTWSQERRAARVLSEAVHWAGPWILAALLYAPIYSQVIDAAGGSSGLFAFSAAALQAFAFYIAACRDNWLLVIVAAAGFASWLSPQRSSNSEAPSGSGYLLVVAVFMLVVPFCLSGVTGIVPFVRNYTPALPFLALAIALFIVQAIHGMASLIRVPAIARHASWIGAALAVLVIVPRLATYPSRLERIRSGQFAQDGYFNYYAARYEPSGVIDFLCNAIDPTQPYLIYYHQEDHAALLHYAAVAGFDLRSQRSDDHEGGPLQVYYIEPDVPPAARGALVGDVPLERLRALPSVADFGYYNVRHSPASAER